MKNIIKTGILFLVAFIMFGCAQNQSSTSSVADLRAGISGLSMEFLQGTPPQKVFEAEIIPVMLKIKNDGAYSITEEEPAVLSIGIEKDYARAIGPVLQGSRVKPLPNLRNAVNFPLDGKSVINQRGDEEFASFNLQAGKLEPQSETHSSSLAASLCYPYETVISSDVCIDTDINNLRPQKKVCTAQDLAFGGGQGAPVTVSKVEVQMLPVLSEKESKITKLKPQFLIFVENRGPGTVIKREAVEYYCTESNVRHSDLNIVYVDAYLGRDELKCQLDKGTNKYDLGHIKLNDRKDIIICWLEKKKDSTELYLDINSDPYLTTLKILLKYGYHQSLSSGYTIEKATRSS